MPKNSFSFKSFVFFNHADPAGILFFNRVFDYAHNCLEAYTFSSPGMWDLWFKNEEFAAPLVSCNAQFKKPILCGKEIEIILNISEVKNTSVTFLFKILQENQLSCEVTTTHVFVDKKTFKKIPIPEIIKSRLEF
jgi:1,4-dihydroxy-2-naphthoyl-CoA hydrolase